MIRNRIGTARRCVFRTVLIQKCHRTFLKQLIELFFAWNIPFFAQYLSSSIIAASYCSQTVSETIVAIRTVVAVLCQFSTAVIRIFVVKPRKLLVSTDLALGITLCVSPSKIKPCIGFARRPNIVCRP